ncbi:MAG: hypothetical protein ASARMPREDX12_006103 [Alectoria sarmentosa]|nr:MAG: hypothetical protein ASARMPREDX12_006103 [Alectoria sarmentosa]
MPIHHDPEQHFSKAYKQEELPHPQHDVNMRRLSEESTGTERCDGPIADIAVDHVAVQAGREGRVSNNGEAVCSDRAELIERIKRGESPTWIPNQALQEEYLKTNNGHVSSLRRQPKAPSPLLPAAELKCITQKQEKQEKQVDTLNNGLSIPLEIQRPRSALHAGDFMEEQGKAKETSRDSPLISRCFDTFQNGPLGNSSRTPWYDPPSSFKGFGSSPQISPSDRDYADSDRRPWRSRAPSLNSYSSSSYVLKAPTTPLVQQSNNTDLDFSPMVRSVSPEKNNRRHTLPPDTHQDMRSSSSDQASTFSQAARHVPSYRREGCLPYGHHQHRSLTSYWSLQAFSSPQSPACLRPRRTSLSSEASPRQHAHMVGSYEESILRGWMSTAPSKPLDFTAQIGVLGKGNCKPRCPAHVTIPFPAVFYSWSLGNGRSSGDDDPSPYVGHIDLQHPLSPPESEEPPPLQAEDKYKSQTNGTGAEHDSTPAKFTPRRSKKRRRTSPASAPPRGSYRIPEQGQLQIIIKNPNKTAVKLFLIPYDLSGMEPGTKTFVRQRSYSADPVIDSPLASKPQPDPAFRSGKPTLRYLIHLNICSPSKGRFYLYQQIRVVFANRVPDNKEQLRNEIQVPQPRFSAYKPTRDPLVGASSSAGAKLTAEKAYRRRSSGFGFGFGSDEADGHATQTLTGGSTFPLNSGHPAPPIPAIPFNLAVSRQRPAKGQESITGEAMDLDASRPTTASDMQSPLSDKTTNHLIGVQLSSSYRSNSSSNGSDGYNKLNKGESGYGGVFGRPGTPEPGEGLLARRLKGLGVQRDSRQVEEEM